MLPTYNKPVFQGNFVSKSMFGREGGSVRLFDKQGELEVEDRDGFDRSVLFPIVYQKRAELARIQTAKGEFHLLTGMFMLNGEPGGMLGRAGGPITGNTSHFIPLGVKGLKMTDQHNNQFAASRARTRSRRRIKPLGFLMLALFAVVLLSACANDQRTVFHTDSDTATARSRRRYSTGFRGTTKS